MILYIFINFNFISLCEKFPQSFPRSVCVLSVFDPPFCLVTYTIYSSGSAPFLQLRGGASISVNQHGIAFFATLTATGSTQLCAVSYCNSSCSITGIQGPVCLGTMLDIPDNRDARNFVIRNVAVRISFNYLCFVSTADSLAFRLVTPRSFGTTAMSVEELLSNLLIRLVMFWHLYLLLLSTSCRLDGMNPPASTRASHLVIFGRI
jgi:hypothetical protein